MNFNQPNNYYDYKNMSQEQAWLKGFHQGETGQGPFGIWRALEEDPTPWNAMLVANWLNGWSKGRCTYEAKNN